MQEYGIIKDGDLSLSSKQIEGYKPVEYAPIPEFDQTTHFVEQLPPSDQADKIYVGVEIKELPKDLLDGEMIDEFI